MSREMLLVWYKASGTISDTGLSQWVPDAEKEAMERPFLEKNHINDVKVEEMPYKWNFRVRSSQFTERRLKENSSTAFKYCKRGRKC